MKNLILGLFIGIGISTTYFTLIASKEVDSSKSLEVLAFDFAEYARLKTMEEKYKKADEILGKVMLLYLANVAAYLDSPAHAYFKKPLEERILVPKTASSSGNDLVQPLISPKDKKVSSSSQDRTEEKNKLVPKISLKSVKKLAKPNIEQAISKVVKSEEVYQRVAGVFTGHLKYEAGKYQGEIHQVELESNFEVEENQLVGRYYMGLSKEGDYYSRNRGNGGNNAIRLSPKGEFILQASPVSFMQLVPTDAGGLEGYYYENNQFFGIVKLYK